MKKIGLITIIDNNNYGNRLQNYAIQEYIDKKNMKTITLKNTPTLNAKKYFLLRICKFVIKNIKEKRNEKRNEKNHKAFLFKEFNNNIMFSKHFVIPFSRLNKKYNYFLTGSDQVWNPYFLRLRDVDLLKFTQNEKKIAFSASFGIDELPKNIKKYAKENLLTFKCISVRENKGKEIVEELTGRDDVEVLIDPTMLLTSEEWDKISKKPEQMEIDYKKKYILNYFLGKLSEQRKTEIERIAKENDCEIINILDEKDPFFVSGPSEFLYLEKNAFLICTDSFHSSVFAILYDRPFVVFDREDKEEKMNSRIDTLISKFNLKNRKYNGSKITKENLEHDYTEAYKILEEERKKSDAFLKKALDIEEE